MYIQKHISAPLSFVDQALERVPLKDEHPAQPANSHVRPLLEPAPTPLLVGAGVAQGARVGVAGGRADAHEVVNDGCVQAKRADRDAECGFPRGGDDQRDDEYQRGGYEQREGDEERDGDEEREGDEHREGCGDEHREGGIDPCAIDCSIDPMWGHMYFRVDMRGS